MDEADIKIGNSFIFSLKNDELIFKILFHNKRKTYTNKQYDITMIELKQNDKLKGYSFLEIDDNVFMDNPNNYYPKKTIYLIHYPNGQKVEFSSGVIKNIFEDNTISHLCTTKTGSSGGPLINILNHKVIGLHKGSKKGKDFNLGTLLKIPIQEFNQKFNNNINSQFKMQNNSFINNNQNMIINNNQNMNFNNNIPCMKFNNNQNMNSIINQNMDFNNNIPFMNFNNNQNMNFNNNIPFMNFNNNQNMDFNNINSMNYNYSPFMNFNNISNLNFNNQDFSYQIFQQMLQMNNLINMGFPNNNSNNENSEDIYPYIQGGRKEIIFINSKKEKNKVKIPISLRKNEIYSLAEKFKSTFYYEIKQLMHNNKILENDDSSIDCILNGDSIKIIEFLDCDLTYYDTLRLKHKNSPKKNLRFEDDKGRRIVLDLPEDITVIEMKKSFLSKMEIPFKYLEGFHFTFNAEPLVNNNETIKIVDFFSMSYMPCIKVITKNLCFNAPVSVKGKRIRVSFYLKDSKKSIDDDIGTLNQIKELHEIIFYLLCSKGKAIIYPGGIEVKRNDERTFSDIGIRDNFICRIVE